VDNLSGGRVAISCAAGWHPSDFVLRPENYEERKEVMLRSLETIRRLWAGETLRLPGGGGQEFEAKLLPRPLQRELPVWVTSSGSTATWVAAGEVGANVLSAMGSQPFEDLAQKIARYRKARRRAGHAGPGVVTVMLHTFLGDDLETVREVVREPLSGYLHTHLRQRDSFLDIPGISEHDKEALIPLAFDHYLRSASLLGTAATCSAMLDRLAAIGVDEAACLVDFGVAPSLIEGSLERLAALRRAREAAQGAASPPAAAEPVAAGAPSAAVPAGTWR
jgi:natural product biosynthesis luciferase-like monooxygenase protein